MDAFLSQLINLLTSPAGILVYYIVVLFPAAWALQEALSPGGDPSTRRLAIGLGAILLLRLGLFLVVLFGWSTTWPALLPLLDRAVNTLTIVVLIWLWNFPSGRRMADAASLLLGGVSIVLMVFSWVWLNAQSPTTLINQTWLNPTWEGLSAVLCLMGVILLVSQRPPGWSVGIGLMLVLFTGHLAQIIVPAGDSPYPLWTRLAQMAAFPLILQLPRRNALPLTAAGSMLASRDLSSLLIEWLAFPVSRPQLDRLNDIAQSLERLFRAQSVILALPEGKPLQLRPAAVAFPDGREQSEGMAPFLPRLSKLMLANQAVNDAANTLSEDLALLTAYLNAPIADLLAAPIKTGGGLHSSRNLLGALIITAGPDATPFSSTDQHTLAVAAQALAYLLGHWETLEVQASSAEEAKNALAAVRTSLSAQEQRNINQGVEMESLRKQLLEERNQARDLAQLLQAAETSGQDTANWQGEVQRLTQSLEAERRKSATQTTQLESELELALKELARARKQLSEADSRAIQAKQEAQLSPHGVAAARQHAAQLGSLIQELRQPLASILGYTDLLLGESVGLLGALQRKFLERIKSSVERTAILADNLVALAGPSAMDVPGMPTSLSDAIDEAIAKTLNDYQRKGQILRIDLPDELPDLHTDLDGIQQTLITLLQNAGEVSPPGSEITIQAQPQIDERDNHEYILIQISDLGGGIPRDDLPRVFTRNARGGQVTISGLGSDQLGIAAAKPIIEAANGRLWVDSLPGHGSTFSIVLPVQVATSQA